jgi:hypothetical protein
MVIHCYGVLSFCSQEYIVSLKQLHDVAPALTQAGSVSPLEVPMELLQYVDDGGNPDVFLADAVKAAVEANQAARGKVEGFREFRRKLLEGLEKGGYPDDVAAYASMREEDKK